MKYVLILSVVLMVGCTSKPADRQQRVNEAIAMKQAYAGFSDAASAFGQGKAVTKTHPVQVQTY